MQIDQLQKCLKNILSGYPGIYAKVAAEIDWIHETIENFKPFVPATHMPFWFETDENFGNSYQNYTDFCASKGGRICTFEEYCPNGEFGNLFDSRIPWYRDSYAPFYDPVGDNFNNWLQVGYHELDHLNEENWQFNKTCWINPWGKPWGLTSSGVAILDFLQN